MPADVLLTTCVHGQPRLDGGPAASARRGCTRARAGNPRAGARSWAEDQGPPNVFFCQFLVHEIEAFEVLEAV